MSKIIYGITDNVIVKRSGEWPKSKWGALRESIRKYKWLEKELDKGKLEYPPFATIKSCALCQLYYDRGTCVVCPVGKKTGQTDCFLTPYDKYRNAVENYNMKAARKAVPMEIVFLESLLPISKKK